MTAITHDGTDLDDAAEASPGFAPTVDTTGEAWSPRVVYGVITRVPKDGEFGNMALGEAYVDAQAFGGSFDEPARNIVDVTKNPALALWIRVPVFRLGELLVLVADRDQFTRKPSKWDVDCETFDNIDDTVRRVIEVTSP